MVDISFPHRFNLDDWVRCGNLSKLKDSINNRSSIDDAMIWSTAPFPHNPHTFWRIYCYNEDSGDQSAQNKAKFYIKVMIHIYNEHQKGNSLEEIKNQLKEMSDEDFGGDWKLFLNIDINRKPMGKKIFNKLSIAKEEGTKEPLYWKTVEIQTENQDAA